MSAMTTSTTKKSSSRRYGGLSEAERVQERRERFLEAGLEVFGTLGLRGATVRTLCRTAGLTERYFYESFEDTESLFCAVYEAQTARLRDFIVAKLPQLPPELDLRTPAALNLYFDFMRDERVVRVIYIESMTGSERASSLHHANTRMGADITVMLFRADHPDLTLSDELLHSLGLAFNGAVTALAVQWMLGDYTIAQDTLVQGCAVLIKGVIRELRANPLPA